MRTSSLSGAERHRRRLAKVTQFKNGTMHFKTDGRTKLPAAGEDWRLE